MKKRLLIVGGANGSGKTTFAKSYLKEHKLFFLNADEITIEKNLNAIKGGQFATGREYFKRLESLKKKEKSFILESTLSGRLLSKLVKEFKAEGYEIEIIFVLVPNVEISIERIKVRVSKGGHHVPETDVIRRFERGRKNFWNIYRKLANRWVMMDNAEFSYETIAAGRVGSYEVIKEKLFEDFLKSII